MELICCATGASHTICLSEDGIAYSFGDNYYGQLGLKQKSTSQTVPTPIPNLPKIKQVSCGEYFAVLIDHENYLWSFGFNTAGQLALGNIHSQYQKTPQKIDNIPPVLSAFCGAAHTLVITDNFDLYSCGWNDCGQLCHEDLKNRSILENTQFSNVIRIGAGYQHSIFQKFDGEVYSCGDNTYGELGLGNNIIPPKPCIIPNLSNIIQFSCGRFHSLFLDIDGNVFSVGGNEFGCLGIGNTSDQSVPLQIKNIPFIKLISCVNESSYLLDIDGFVWSFGDNIEHRKILVPTKINFLKNICNISNGNCSHHFLAKDSEDKIFIIGDNSYGQLTGTSSGNGEMESSYFKIWGSSHKSRAKSARK